MLWPLAPALLANTLLPCRHPPHCFLRLHFTSSFRLLGHRHWATDSSPGQALLSVLPKCWPAHPTREPPEDCTVVCPD